MVRNLTHSEDKIQQKRWNQQRYAEEQEEQRIVSIIEAEKEKVLKIQKKIQFLTLKKI